MSKISIVIPVYNAAEFIHETLHSIYSGIVKPDQVIVVDDGSTDNSKQICEELQQKMYSSMVLVGQENRGVSSARNHGIMYVTSDYIWFVDADDWIKPDAVQYIKKSLESINCNYPDIILSNMSIVTSREIEKDKYVNEYDRQKLVCTDRNQLFSYLYGELDIGWTVWRHLFRTEFIQNNNLYFDESLRMFEDMDYMNRAINQAEIIDAINETLYLHRFDNEKSLTRQKRTINTFLNYINTCIKWFGYYENKFPDGIGKDTMLNCISDSYKCAFTFITQIDDEEKENAFHLYLNHFDIAKYHTFEQFDRTLLIK